MYKLFVVALAMFGFGYALVPLYDIFCEITGTGGVTRLGKVESAKLDNSRLIKVEFTAHTDPALPWEFRPMQTKMMVHPGEVVVAKYYARNNSSHEIVGQSAPSVSPPRAANHFKKIECFCFTKQKLKAGETREMPVQFYVDAKVPEEVDTITLSYTFYNISKVGAKIKKDGGRPITVNGQRLPEHQTNSGTRDL